MRQNNLMKIIGVLVVLISNGISGAEEYKFPGWNISLDSSGSITGITVNEVKVVEFGRLYAWAQNNAVWQGEHEDRSISKDVTRQKDGSLLVESEGILQTVLRSPDTESPAEVEYVQRTIIYPSGRIEHHYQIELLTPAMVDCIPYVLQLPIAVLGDRKVTAEADYTSKSLNGEIAEKYSPGCDKWKKAFRRNPVQKLTFHTKAGDLEIGRLVKEQNNIRLEDERSYVKDQVVQVRVTERRFSPNPQKFEIGTKFNIDFEIKLPVSMAAAVLKAKDEAKKENITASNTPAQVIEFTEDELRPSGYQPFPENWGVIDLAGFWKLKKLPGTENDPEKDKGMIDGFWKENFNDADWKDFPVPWSWDHPYPPMTRPVSGEISKQGIGWYRKNILIPKEYNNPGTRVLLHFDAVDYEAVVWINGKNAGEKISRCNPIDFDITEYVKFGEQNTIAVRCFNKKDIHGFMTTGGIWQNACIINCPGIYATRTLISPLLDKSGINIDCRMMNASNKSVSINLRGEVSPAADKVKAGQKDFGQVTLKPGTNNLHFFMALNDPVCWTPDNPYLYVLRIYDQDNNMNAKIRFGFREFKVKGKFFFLNNKRIYLTGDTGQGLPPYYQFRRGDIWYNKGNWFKKYLLSLKKANFNILRIVGPWPQPLYDICDEIGLLINDIWDCQEKGPDGLMKMSVDIKEWVYGNYNHPSVVIWGFGNELYEHHARLMDQSWTPVLDHLYDMVKEMDGQQRPISVSSGRHTEDDGGKTDVCDDHQYFCWYYLKDYIDTYNAKANEIYGEIPMLTTEAGGWGGRYYDEVVKKLKEGTFTTADYVKWTQTQDDYNSRCHRWWLSATGIESLRDAPESMERLRAEKLGKRLIEVYRRAGDKVAGIVPQIYSRVVDMNPPAFVDPLDKVVFYKGPGFELFGNAFSPLFVCADEFDRNLFSGDDLKAKICVINDTAKEDTFNARVVIRDPDKKELHKDLLEGLYVPNNSRIVKDYSWRLPADLKTGFYYLAMELIKVEKPSSIEKVVSTNCYQFFAVNRNDLTAELKTAKKVALYDIENKTRSVLDKLKINYQLVNDFNQLDEYEILIIGMDSLDDKVMDSGAHIRDWLEKGGYVLCFEQYPAGSKTVPWLEGRKISSCSPYTFVDMAVPKHPVFDGLSQDNWDTWNNDSDGNAIFKALISPLGEELVATGMGNNMPTRAVIQTVIADMKIKKGNCVLSQPLAIQRYEKDSVATKYIQNLLGYVLKGSEQKWAAEIKEEWKGEKKLKRKVEKERCYFVDLKPYVNMGFKDETAYDQKGGWDDAGGNNDMRNFPTGQREFDGVPFQLINPAENDGKGCIVLRNNSKRYSFLPQKVTGIKIGKKYASDIYFLHVTTCTPQKSMPVAKYVIHYCDGTTLIQEIRSRVQIADWWEPAGLPEADVGWNGSNLASSTIGVYVFNWQNPSVAQAIESIDFISEETTAISVLIAITMREVGGLEIQ